MKKRDVAAILLFNDKKEILLQHRTMDAKKLPGYWAFFGGGIEPYETPLDAVKREAMEELRYPLQQPKKVMVKQFIFEDVEVEMHVYLEVYDDAKKLELHEGQDLRWVSISTAETMKMADHDREVLVAIEGTY